MRIRIDPLDREFSKMVRLKKPLCEVCAKHPSSQVHHFKGRRHQNTRYDEENCWAVCFGCHRRFEEDPSWAVAQQQKRLGKDYDAFIMRANMIKKRTSSDKKVLTAWIKNEIERIERGVA